ncbi:MAG: RnfABCDGE type electron transport complex subunit D [Candidatus Cloacimonetes bacterium]|nr:RnfABCDGE type electron transport complex subunit D [Candidatus Cloacimonadota bacterium]
MLKKLFLQQKIMDRVLYALIPLVIYGIFRFGWQVLAIVLVSNVFAVLTEYLFIRQKKGGRISGAVWVTGTLLALILPPTLPLWMAALGAIVAVSFGKMVFGGFGMNIFNPALVGRIFLFVTFPQQMGASWQNPFRGFPGGLAAWNHSAALTSATPIAALGNGQTSFWNLFSGNTAGCIGEVSTLLILLAGVYLILTKTAKWQPMAGGIISFLVFTLLFYGANPFYYFAAGGVAFGMVFMITDPVSMPKDKRVIWINAALVGFLAVVIRKYSNFDEGFMFALLLGNTFSPLLDYAWGKKKGVK